MYSVSWVEFFNSKFPIFAFVGWTYASTEPGSNPDGVLIFPLCASDVWVRFKPPEEKQVQAAWMGDHWYHCEQVT